MDHGRGNGELRFIDLGGIGLSELSVGFLSHSVHLLRLVENQPGINIEKLTLLATKDDLLLRGNHLEIIDGLLSYKWIEDENGNVKLSDSLPSPTEENEILVQRELLWLFILSSNPTWVRRMKGGIMDTRDGISSSNMIQVFRDLGLFLPIEEISDEAIEWWRRASYHSRMISDDKLIETGNRGEMLTIRYERERTNSKPKYMAMDSSSHGYDIKSQVSGTDPTPLMIEVKSSQWPNFRARLHLTRNELDTCLENQKNYVFHLWDLSSDKERLLVVSPEEMLKHVPKDSGKGKWESLEVPFSAFDWDNMVSL